MELTFRAAMPEDAVGLLALNAAFNGPSDQTAEQIAQSLARPSNERVFVAQAGSQGLVGFCCCQVKESFCYGAPQIEVSEFYVDNAFRRQGAGTGLMACAAALCRGLGADELTLLTGDDNLVAQAFYAKMGFQPTGELHLRQEPLQ